MVDALQYVTLTRPDSAFSVNKICQYMAFSLDSHWTTIKCIMHYLSDTLDHDFLISPAPHSCKLSLCAYNDFDLVSDLDDRRSTSGSCNYLGTNLI